jgi:glycosyltransferase involved in cell wall biosynthesis
LGRAAGALGDPARSIDYHLGREDFHFPGTRQLFTLTPELPDLVHAHNLHGGYFDLRVLPWLSEQVPLFLTLHDAWLLSGHCAQSFECERWRTGCGHCPDLSIYPAVRHDLTAHNFRRKRAILSRSRLHLATPSRWLMDKVEQSMLRDGLRHARVIPNGIDLSVFRPRDRHEARAALGLPAEARIVLTTGVKLGENQWKDFPTLLEAVSSLNVNRNGRQLHVVVLGTPAEGMDIGRVQMQFVPYRTDTATVATYYQAADVYVHATRADTFPLAVLEALACGTAVVASSVGGIPEQIEDGRSGLLIPPGDVHALAAGIDALLRDRDLRTRIVAEGTRDVRRRFDLDMQVSAYLNWYDEVLHDAARDTRS